MPFQSIYDNNKILMSDQISDLLYIHLQQKKNIDQEWNIIVAYHIAN